MGTDSKTVRCTLGDAEVEQFVHDGFVRFDNVPGARRTELPGPAAALHGAAAAPSACPDRVDPCRQRLLAGRAGNPPRYKPELT
jgi:hypothetical protein